MIDHLGIRVRNVEASRGFYAAALAPLGIKVVMEIPEGNAFGFGLSGSTVADLQSGKPSFWIAQAANADGTVHIAFEAANHAAVEAFHGAALGAGGLDNGKPGFRPNYHDTYYAAFVFDPDGNNVEAVCHTKGESKPRRMG